MVGNTSACSRRWDRGHGQKHICLNHQVDGDQEEDECDDDKYHRSIAQGSCNWWPSKLAPYNVSVDDP